MNCPRCGSGRTKKLSKGIKATAAKGAALGGFILPGIGTAIGGALGALTGTITTAVARNNLDQTVLNNRKCNSCSHEWQEEVKVRE